MYGGDPESWLRIPPPLLKAYSIMRPRIEAERLLSLYEAVMAGTGSGRKAATQQWVKQMQREAHVDAGGTRKPKTIGDWAAIGMRVHEEPKGG